MVILEIDPPYLVTLLSSRDHTGCIMRVWGVYEEVIRGV